MSRALPFGRGCEHDAGESVDITTVSHGIFAVSLALLLGSSTIAGAHAVDGPTRDIRTALQHCQSELLPGLAFAGLWERWRKP